MMHFVCLAQLNSSGLCRVFSTKGPSLPPTNLQPDAEIQNQLPSYDAVRNLRNKFVNPSLNSNLFYSKPLYVTQGKMQWLWDRDGRRYLDMFAGIVTVSVGHCHPVVVEAAEKQLRRLWHTSNIYMTHPIHEYAEKLTATLPGDLKVVYFTNSGSEANDMAIMMARLYTGAYDVIALRNAYHGMTSTVAQLCAVGAYKHALPSHMGVHHAINADPYRGIYGGALCRDSPTQVRDRNCECGSRDSKQNGGKHQCDAAALYADQIADLLKHCVPQKKIAGFFAESIQGVGGTVQFPRGYLSKVCELVRSYGGVFVADEVQTGFGRTGEHFWGFEGHGIIPDIVTMAKGIGNGFPLAAVVTTPAIAAAFNRANFFNTYGGNPVACAVGSAVLDVIAKDRCQENCHGTGTYFLEKLNSMADECRLIGDVRGKGLMIGVELVSNQKKLTPITPQKMGEILDDCKEMGLLIGKGGTHGNVLRIKPPMCITKTDVDFTLDVLKMALCKAETGN